VARSYSWRTWTAKEDRLLEGLRQAGLSYAACAAELGRSAGSVAGRCAEKGLRRVYVRREAWLEVLSLPLTSREAARRMGVGVRQAKRRRAEMRAAGVIR